MKNYMALVLLFICLPIVTVQQGSQEVTCLPGINPVPGSPLQVGRGWSLKYHPKGTFLAVSNFAHESINIFSVNQQTGELKEIRRSPFGTARPEQISYNRDGSLLALTTQMQRRIYLYRVHRDGSISEAPGSPQHFPGQLTGVSFSPTNNTLKVIVNRPIGSHILTYLIRNTRLGVPINIGTDIHGGQSVVYSPNGRFYVITSEQGKKLDWFGVKIRRATYDLQGGRESSGNTAFTHDSKFLAVPHYHNGLISVYKVEENERLTLIPGAPFNSTQRGARTGVFTPDSELFIVANRISHSISIFKTNPTTGVLSLLEVKKGIVQAVEVAMHPSGKFFAVSSAYHARLYVYCINRTVIKGETQFEITLVSVVESHEERSNAF